jgi:hypothetical protein
MNGTPAVKPITSHFIDSWVHNLASYSEGRAEFESL